MRTNPRFRSTLGRSAVAALALGVLPLVRAWGQEAAPLAADPEPAAEAQPVAAPTGGPSLAEGGGAFSEGVSAALATLLDTGAPESARLDAARVLAGACWSEDGRRATLGVLGTADGAASGLMLRALSREATLPETLLPALTDLAGSVDGDRLARVLTAAGAIRTPESLRLVARFLDGGIAESARSAAHMSLIRATGRDDLPATPQAWLDWIDGVEAASSSGGATWSSVLLRGVAERADRLNARARDVAGRLVETQRRLYVSSEAGQRGAALAALITDQLADIRGLGFDLLERELASAPQPAPEVVAALMSLLGHEAPGVRAQAATFIGRIAPEGAGEAVAAALEREQDAAAAGALLTAASRWPSGAIAGPVLRWLENGPVNRVVAANAALAMHRAGAWSTEDLDRVARVMRGVPSVELSPAGCRLVAAIGTDEDRRSLSTLLISGTPAQRLAVAEALTGRAEYVDSITAAASRDAALVPAASRAVAQHRPTIEGFRAVARLACPDEQVRRAALRTVGEVLGTGSLLSAADETGGDSLTTQWLLERARSQAQEALASGDPRAPDLLFEAAERLARLHLELSRPAEAIAAMDAVPSGPGDTRFNPLRTVALLMLGRLADAASLDAGAEVWLSALERCVAMAHAGAMADLIQTRFAGVLSPEQLDRLASLRARAAEASGPKDPG